MCYAKPGPRCSNHAHKAFLKALSAYKESPTLDTYRAMKVAEEEYDTTPAGQRLLSLAVDMAEPGTDYYYESVDKLARAKERRQNAFKAWAKKYGKEIPEEEREPQEPQKLEQGTRPGPGQLAVLPSDPVEGLGAINTEDLSEANIHVANSLDVDYSYGCDSYYCGEDHDYGDCADEVNVHSYRITDNRNFVRALLGETPSHQVFTDEEVDNIIGDETDRPALSREISVLPAYDSSGAAYEVEISDDLKRKVETLYYSRSNACDPHGVLSYARAEGVDTTGKTPKQVLQEMMSSRVIPKTIEKIISSPSAIRREPLRLDNVRVSRSALSATGAYKLEGHREEIAGIAVCRRDGKMQLIAGFERFNGAIKSKEMVHDFIVISE